MMRVSSTLDSALKILIASSLNIPRFCPNTKFEKLVQESLLSQINGTIKLAHTYTHVTLDQYFVKLGQVIGDEQHLKDVGCTKTTPFFIIYLILKRK